MSQPPQPAAAPTGSGVDLARQALAAARSQAARRGNQPTKATPARRRSARGEGRDPQPLAAILGHLGAEQGWEQALSGGGILDKWAQWCPQFAGGEVTPAGYDPDTGRLDLAPASPAYAAQLRLLGGQLAKQINTKAGRIIVRSIRVLPPRAAAQGRPGAGALEAVPPPAASVPVEGPVRTRKTASAGYRTALAAHHSADHAPTITLPPGVPEAAVRQEAALRQHREPASGHLEARWAEADTPSGPEPGSVEASLAAALTYKRRGATGSSPRRAFDAA